MKNSLKYVLGAMTCQGISFDMQQPILNRLAKNMDACLIFQNEQVSIPQVLRRTLSIIEILKKMNCQSHPIAFCLPNSPELLCWHLACLHLGIVFVPIVYEQDPKIISKILNSITTKCFFTTSLKLNKLSKIVFPVGCSIKIIDDKVKAIRVAHSEQNTHDIDLEAVLMKLLNSVQAVNTEQPAMILFSSDPKSPLKEIRHSHQSFNDFIEKRSCILQANPKMIFVIAEPLGDIENLSTILLTLLNNGNAILLEKFEVESYLQILKTYRPTHINLEASHLTNIIHHRNFDRNDFESIICCLADSITNEQIACLH